MTQNPITDTHARPAAGYHVWADGDRTGKTFWRFTAPGGDFDSNPYPTQEAANHASHLYEAKRVHEIIGGHRGS